MVADSSSAGTHVSRLVSRAGHLSHTQPSPPYALAKKNDDSAMCSTILEIPYAASPSPEGGVQVSTCSGSAVTSRMVRRRTPRKYVR